MAISDAIGAAITTWRGLNDDVMSRCPAIVDWRDSCLKETCDVIQPGADIHRQISEVTADTAKVDPI